MNRETIASWFLEHLSAIHFSARWFHRGDKQPAAK
jgi:hypothetical protein